jgi:hypothetical protein
LKASGFFLAQFDSRYLPGTEVSDVVPVARCHVVLPQGPAHAEEGNLVVLLEVGSLATYFSCRRVARVEGNGNEVYQDDHQVKRVVEQGLAGEE